MNNPATQAFRSTIDLVSRFHENVMNHDTCIEYLGEIKAKYAHEESTVNFANAIERRCNDLYRYLQNLWGASVLEGTDIETTLSGLQVIKNNYTMIINSHLTPYIDDTSERHHSSPIDRESIERRELQAQLRETSAQARETCSIGVSKL